LHKARIPFAGAAILPQGAFKVILTKYPAIGIKILIGFARFQTENLRKTSNQLNAYTHLLATICKQKGDIPKNLEQFLAKDEEHIFLGKEMGQSRDFSEQTALDIDFEIKKVVNDNYLRAKEILNGNMELLHKLSKKLLEEEVMDAKEIDGIIFGDEIPEGVKTTRDEKIPTDNKSAGDKTGLTSA